MQKSGTPVTALKDLQRIPGVGPSLAQDLADLGIRRVTALRRRSPERLYEQLCTLRGQHQDKCVLYAFRCAVYFASEQHHDPERLKWWNWKDAKPWATFGSRHSLGPFQRKRRQQIRPSLRPRADGAQRSVVLSRRRTRQMKLRQRKG